MSEVKYGNVLNIKKEVFSYGLRRTLFTSYSEISANAFIFDFEKATDYINWAEKDFENLCIVEDGSLVLKYNNEDYPVKKGEVFKIFPGQAPTLIPSPFASVLSIQMPSKNSNFDGEVLSKLKIVHTELVPSKVYEYETLGQEVVTCNYSPGLGLLKFTFPNKIPIHKHPYSGRLIRPISGLGFSYVAPDRYDMNKNTFSLFPKGTIHTNGPLPGEVFTLWAIQMPWVDSKIDIENIAGDKDFVQYIESEPPKPLWKTKSDLERVIKKLS